MDTEKIQAALVEFETQNFPTSSDADEFFGRYGVGNVIQEAQRPYERFTHYEALLKVLHDADSVKYTGMHKGTPFFFLAWLAFDMRNYETALFYMDAGVSEDIRQTPSTWMQLPGPKFLRLDSSPGVAERTRAPICQTLEAELTRFNGVSVRPAIDLVRWRELFVDVLLADPPRRTILSAFYVFLLEFDDREQELELRKGGTGGSSQPFTVHLFKGGLLLESLLKCFYPQFSQLGQILRDPSFKSAFQSPPGVSIGTSANSLTEILAAVSGDTLVSALETAAKLRNTTGHNLVWDNIFDDPAKYKTLFRQVINALFYVISFKYCDP